MKQSLMTRNFVAALVVRFGDRHVFVHHVMWLVIQNSTERIRR